MVNRIFILGAARSGKTTLAQMLAEKFGCGILSLDAFVSAFEENYPELGIFHHSQNNHLIAPFVASYVNSFAYNYPQFNMIIEGSHITLADAVKLFGRKFEFIVLGYPQLTPLQVVENVRRYEKTSDYTISLDNEKLLQMALKHITYSQNLEKECKKFNLTFYDTSHNREKVLNCILQKVKSS